MPDNAAPGAESVPGAAAVAGQNRAGAEGLRGGRTGVHREGPAPETKTVPPREGSDARRQGAPQRKEASPWHSHDGLRRIPGGATIEPSIQAHDPRATAGAPPPLLLGFSPVAQERRRLRRFSVRTLDLSLPSGDFRLRLKLEPGPEAGRPAPDGSSVWPKASSPTSARSKPGSSTP